MVGYFDIDPFPDFAMQHWKFLTSKQRCPFGLAGLNVYSIIPGQFAMYPTITVMFVMSYSVVKRQTQPLPYLDLRARDEWGGSRPLGCYLHWASVRSETQTETNASTISAKTSPAQECPP